MIDEILEELQSTIPTLAIKKEEAMDFRSHAYASGYIDGVDYAIRVIKMMREESL